jgi:NADH-quinone oxidoreductase subunit G
LEQTIAVSVEAITLGFIEEVPFGIFERPVIICGTKNSSVSEIKYLARAEAKLALLPGGPNSFGAALLAGRNGATSLEEALATGRIKGIISVEADIPQQLLAGIPFVAAFDWRCTPVVQAAQIVFPATSWVEMDGTWINYEGRAQRFKKVMQPGLPVQGLDPSGHPAHCHRLDAVGGGAHPAWEIIAALIAALGGEAITEPLQGEWAKLRGLDAESEGVLIDEL